MWRSFLKNMKMEKIQYRYGELRGLPDDVEETRTVEFVISDETKDRHGTVLSLKGWQLDNFNRNGIVGYQHNVYGGDMCNAPNPDDVIGRGEAFIEGDKLIGRVTFEPADINPLAEKIFRKVLFGTLRATSVGFKPIGKGNYGEKDEAKGKENETYYFNGQELVEFSIVNIPSNPNAVRRDVGTQTANALMYIRKILGMSFADIEKMTVREVIDLIESKDYQEQRDTEIIEKQKSYVYLKEFRDRQLELLNINQNE